MSEIDRDLAPAPPSAALEARVRSAIGEIRPVKPLLPPFARAGIAAVLGVGLVIAFAQPIADAQPRQAGAVGLVLVAAVGLWFSMRLAVPGNARLRIPGSFWLALPVLFAGKTLAELGMAGQVHGVACLVLGGAIAVLPLVAASALVARAFPVQPALTGAIAGVSAGAFGLALLTINCPMAEGPHLLVFHGGVLILSLAVGALAGLAVAFARR